MALSSGELYKCEETTFPVSISISGQKNLLKKTSDSIPVLDNSVVKFANPEK
jgi:hypothetical protein